ncbi:MAG: DUF6273 domain-containing protein [Clostridiales bacterium]|nr:DUF6273 domain-containing protein [Clostridiales bacterium]
MRRRFIGIISALLAVIFVLTACSGNNNEEETHEHHIEVAVEGLEDVQGTPKVEVIKDEVKAETLAAVKDDYYIEEGAEVYAVDISIVNGDEEVEVGKPVTVSIELPQAELPLDQYVVLHVHDGITEEIIPTVVNGKLTFTVDSFSPFLIVPKHVHKFGEWEYAYGEPTCGEAAIQERVCACGKKETRDITVNHIDENKDNICDRCGKNLGAEHVHEFGAWNTVKAATCTEAGTEMRECACGEVETRFTDPLGHIDEDHDDKCDRCGYEFKTVHTHSFGEWSTYKIATCTEYGTQERYCECGEKETRIVDPLGHIDEDKDGKCDRCGLDLSGEHIHIFGAWTTVKAATCTETGTEERVCACGEKETRTVEALGHVDADNNAKCDRCGASMASVHTHVFGEWKTVTPATCTETGTEERVCACGEKEMRTVAALGHVDANKDNKCDRCGKNLSGEHVHSYGEWTTVKKATCTEAGSEERVCSCGSVETRGVAALGHIDSNKDNKCDRCGASMGEHTHTFGEWTTVKKATCTEAGSEERLCSCGTVETRTVAALGHVDDNKDGKCDRCGASMSGEHTHSFGEWTTVKPANCTDAGMEERVCACGEKETRTIAALGHVDDNKDGKCDKCGASMSEHTHTFGEWYVAVKATCTEEGTEERKCECGYSETRKVEALGHIDENKDNKCDRCGAEMGTGVVVPETYSIVGDKVLFGSYPQTKMTDESLISILNGLAGALPGSSPSEYNGWTSYKYYRGANNFNTSSNVFDFMFYKDVTYQGTKYRGVYMVAYRPNSTIRMGTLDNTYQDDNGYKFGKNDSYLLYWFRFDPIEWRVLKKVNGKALLIADIIIDSQAFLDNPEYVGLDEHSNSIFMNKNAGVPEGIYANNYEYSTIRAWLNDNFYNTSFTALQKQLIMLTNVNNGIKSSMPTNGNNGVEKWNSGTKFLCYNTSDYIFLPSEAEITSLEYGFMTPFDRYSLDKQRIRSYSDYAACQGLWVHNNVYTQNVNQGEYWLRSPIEYSDGGGYGEVCKVDEEGYCATGCAVFDTCIGVVPMLWIDLTSN